MRSKQNFSTFLATSRFDVATYSTLPV